MTEYKLQPICAYRSVGLRCLILRISLVWGSTDGLLVGGGSSGRSLGALRLDLVRLPCLRSTLVSATVSPSSSRGLKEGRGGSGGMGALFDGTRCGYVWCDWERLERLRRGVS